MKKKLIYLLVLLAGFLFILPGSSYAEESVDNAFEIDYPIKDRSQAEWAAAVKYSLPQLLVKVSGNPDIVKLPIVRENLTKPDKYIRSYSYTTQKAEEGKLPLVLHLTYDSRAIDQLLSQAGHANQAAQSISEKPENVHENANPAHPLTLIWLAVKTLKQEYIISNSMDDQIAHILKAGAERRGLPIILPLMDLSDWSNISQADIAKLDPTLLETASKRYSPAVVLEGQLIQTAPKYWEGQWALNIKGENLRWNTEGENVENVIDNALEDVVKNVAVRSTNISTAQESNVIKIKVLGVEGLEDYAEVVNYLRSLSFVSNVEVVDVSASDIVVELTTQGKMDNIATLLSQDNKLRADTINQETLSATSELVYRWVSQQPQQPVLPVPGNTLQ